MSNSARGARFHARPPIAGRADVSGQAALLAPAFLYSVRSV
jgi:hypothetical protein